MDIVSTYRLQFNKGFTFRDAAQIVPYLHDLGITHVYASPYLKAVAGSMHGYDVVDPTQLNPEIGTTQDYRLFVDTLARYGMSHILDTVPNHMGVETNDNHWWNDVLTSGKSSRHADFFDIDWDGFAPRRELVGKVLMPVLGETLAQALANESLALRRENSAAFFDYHGRRFPIDPRTMGDQELPALLNAQHYRLSYWRVSADEINYRRFFDITGLAALQMHRQGVFDAVHEFTFRLVAEGSVSGLRVDHPDGLLDPQEYFDRLQTKYRAVCPGRGPLYVAVEKILNGDEKLCDNWAVSGTSGYDFLCAVNDLLVDQNNQAALTEVYESFTADSTAYEDWAYRSKCAVLDTAMRAELESLTNRLDALAQSELSSQDFTRRQLHDALREVIACFPVYRSYVSSRGVSESDIAVVQTALGQARRRNPGIDPSVFDFLTDSVLLRYPVSDSNRSRQLDFARRFQQLTSPINAKGIEDCTFYNYNRLVSLNEVGGDPGRFGRSIEALHAYFSERQAKWPGAMSSLSTHDTKRSEDVRARLNVLSELPDEWAASLAKWRRINLSVCGNIHPNDQILLYQTLLGAWPLQPMDAQRRKVFAHRITAYMVKATREAKQRNSWIRPDTAYEAAMQCLIEMLIDPQSGADFLAEFLPFQKKISRLGMLNSLSQTVIRLTAPGVCDTYQGTELWDFSLVDPDNRRPVDYQHRIQTLASLHHSKLADDMDDGRIKQWVTRQLLHHRRRSPELYLKGSYTPIAPAGTHAGHLFCFARVSKNQSIIVIAPRLQASLPEQERWIDARITVPEHCLDHQFTNILTGEPVSIAEEDKIDLAHELKRFPVGVIAGLEI